MAKHLPRVGRLLARTSLPQSTLTRAALLRRTPAITTLHWTPGAPRPQYGNTTSVRTYSSGQSDEDDDGRERREARAFAFQMMNPVTWIKLKLNTMYIQSRIDQEFTLDGFMFGAAQAFKVLLLKLTANDYDSLEGLVTSEAMKWLRDNYHGADPNLDFTLKNEELVVRKPKNIDITEDGELNRVHVDTLFAAVKIKEKPYMILGMLRFQRDYREGNTSEWIISEVQQLTVKEVGSISF